MCTYALTAGCGPGVIETNDGEIGGVLLIISRGGPLDNVGIFAPCGRV